MSHILPDVWKNFYAESDAEKNMTMRKTNPSCNDQTLSLTTADVRKAVGPDNIPGRVLGERADRQISLLTEADVLTDIT